MTTCNQENLKKNMNATSIEINKFKTIIQISIIFNTTEKLNTVL